MGLDQPKQRHPTRPDLVKVYFLFSEQDRAGGVEAESLWAEAVGDRKFRIDNLPFYVYGVSLGDIVVARLIEGRLVFDEVVARGGRMIDCGVAMHH